MCRKVDKERDWDSVYSSRYGWNEKKIEVCGSAFRFLAFDFI